MSGLFYSLASEQIKLKVGTGEDLHYPNDTFYSFACICIFSLSVLLIILLAVQNSLHIAVLILHLDFCIIIIYLLFCMRLAKQWINTIICAIDSVFVVEEVLRRGRRNPQTRPTVQQQGPIVQQEQQKNKEFLSVDINKLDAAFKSGMFHRH
tara:strand:- start:16467 stop:16922 length:456 start_codon:yes stop_codon:yes gene_type:complete